MAIPGLATTEGTHRFQARSSCPDSHFHKIGDQQWSSVGIGTYLGARDEQTDRSVTDAVIASVKGGINVIDTASNYRSERAEKSVGLALSQLIEDGVCSRDEVIVCTKGGYLPFGAPGFLKDVAGQVGDVTEHDMVGNSHCMHPDYLDWQMNRSFENLGLESIDVYYLHNPESQAGKVDADVFEQRILDAFRLLEGAVKAGKIGAYGIASWNAFRLPTDKPAYMSLEKAKSLARRAANGERDHFRFIQLPVNLGALEGLRTPNQTVGNDNFPAIRAALALGIRAIASGSIGQAKISALSEGLRLELGEGLNDFQRALQFTRSAPAVATALIGMKQSEHVHQNLDVCKLAPLTPAQARALYS